MIRSRLNELRAQGSRTVALAELARETGIARNTVAKVAASRLEGIHSSTLNALCKYFGCGVGDLLEYVPDVAEETGFEAT